MWLSLPSAPGHSPLGNETFPLWWPGPYLPKLGLCAQYSLKKPSRTFSASRKRQRPHDAARLAARLAAPRRVAAEGLVGDVLPAGAAHALAGVEAGAHAARAARLGVAASVVGEGRAHELQGAGAAALHRTTSAGASSVSRGGGGGGRGKRQHAPGRRSTCRRRSPCRQRCRRRGRRRRRSGCEGGLSASRCRPRRAGSVSRWCLAIAAGELRAVHAAAADAQQPGAARLAVLHEHIRHVHRCLHLQAAPAERSAAPAGRPRRAACRRSCTSQPECRAARACRPPMARSAH